MQYKINTAFLIGFIFVATISISKLANFVSIDKQIAHRLQDNLRQNKEWNYRRKKIKIQNGTDHLMWFVQISDIHLSIFRDEGRQRDFREFATKTIDIIKPPIVLVSGDLTDARGKNILSSNQYEGEWMLYKNILDETNVANRTVWLDIRGNHDTFNVPSLQSEANYFLKYSVQGAKHPRSYMTQITVGKDKYSFIAIDACQNPGTKRPFNFVGILDVNQTNSIIDLAEESRRTGANYIIWFGHYPTSTILSPGTGNSGLSGILGQYEEGYIYLSGHLHTLGGLIKEMYTLQRTQFLELEIGDWKDNRMFRVAAYDHGLFSFVDVKHNSWPIILITNPKHARFNVPTKEDPALQMESTHIRILIFDPDKIVICKVRINSEEFQYCSLVSHNLFVSEWDPSKYKAGIHKIEVRVYTADGRTKSIEQPFSLDGTKMGFTWIAELILMNDITKECQALFGFALALCILPLCLMRIWHEIAYARKVSKPNLRGSCIRRAFRKLWILSSVNRLFYPMLLFALYALIGPWSAGHLIDGHVGVIFSWGIFINGHYLPGTLNYLYGFFQLMFCQFPLVFIFACIASNRYDEVMGRRKSIPKSILCAKIFSILPLATIIFIEITLTSFYWMAYGSLETLFGPLRIWSILGNFVMYYMARNLPKHTLVSAMFVIQ